LLVWSLAGVTILDWRTARTGDGAALELGADAVLVNTAIATAADPVLMAQAFKMAVEAGELARKSGLARFQPQASATSPLTGFLSQFAEPQA